MCLHVSFQRWDSMVRGPISTQVINRVATWVLVVSFMDLLSLSSSPWGDILFLSLSLSLSIFQSLSLLILVLSVWELLLSHLSPQSYYLSFSPLFPIQVPRDLAGSRACLPSSHLSPPTYQVCVQQSVGTQPPGNASFLQLLFCDTSAAFDHVEFCIYLLERGTKLGPWSAVHFCILLLSSLSDV